MIRSKHSYSLLRYQFSRKVTSYLLLLLFSLSVLTILLIIVYSADLIGYGAENVALLTFFKRSQRQHSIPQNLKTQLHVVVSSTNRQLRDWHTWRPSDLAKNGDQQLTQPPPFNIGQRYSNSNNQNGNGIKLTGFNVRLSESLPLRRPVPDTRHKKCKAKLYPAQLPSCSIIIVYYNEESSVLLRTLYSIWDRTPDELLQEIILVNDFSESLNKDEQKALEKYLAENFPQKLWHINLQQREGLIRARLVGARQAKGDVLVFLDAHVEVNENWLPPLLAPIVENPNTTTTPIIDIIKYDTLEYQGGMPSRGGFNWQFNYVQLSLLKEEEAMDPEPHNNPIMNGGLFAIGREYFWQLGGYDRGLEIWGAEQYELSFKIWLCGGRLLEVPCSRVGHLYRSPEFAVSYTKRKDDFISKVWMDEYKEYLYEHIPKLNQIEPGILTEQKQLRSQLQCKPFKWFMQNIAPDLLKAYPPVKPPDFASGAIQSLARPELCLDMQHVEPRQELKNVLKTCSPDLKYPYDAQKWHLGFRRDLQHHGNCLEVQSWTSNAPIWLWPCHNRGGNQWWYYDRNTQMLVQGKESYQQRCMEMEPATGGVFVNFCDLTKPEQKWHFGYVNETAMEKFFEDE